MDSYIEDQRHVGELDSEGTFTINTVGALRKTLASALPESHYYLFQIAQGLIAGGATNIEIAIGRNATRFQFSDPNGTFVDLDAAKARLSQGLTLSSSRPLDLLLTGMATAVGAEMDRADLHPASGEQSLQISLDQAVLADRPEGTRSNISSLELHRSVSKGLSFAWTRIWGARGEEGDLQRRFEFATPPLKIAGFSTIPGSGWRAEVSLLPGVGRLILMEAAVIDDSRFSHRGPQLETVAPHDDSTLMGLWRRAYNEQGEPLSLADDAEQWQRRLWSFYGTGSTQVESPIWWIRNGMTVECTLLNLGMPGVLVLAPADGLDLDASGYALVRNDKFEARVEQAADLARQTLGSAPRFELTEALSACDLAALAARRAQGAEAATPAPTVEELMSKFLWLSPQIDPS